MIINWGSGLLRVRGGSYGGATAAVTERSPT